VQYRLTVVTDDCAGRMPRPRVFRLAAPLGQMGCDDCIAVRRPASLCFDRNALDLSQRETGVPRDADIVVDTHVRRHRTHHVRDRTGGIAAMRTQSGE
jgi:hypothetical protein